MKHIKEFNEYERVYMTHYKMEWKSRNAFDNELETYFGVYPNGPTHYISYRKKFSDLTKMKLFADFDYDDYDADDICLDLPLLFGFVEIKRFHEVDAIKAFEAQDTVDEPNFWENWLYFEDGTILNPEDTKKYFESYNGGIKQYFVDIKRTKEEEV